MSPPSGYRNTRPGGLGPPGSVPATPSFLPLPLTSAESRRPETLSVPFQTRTRTEASAAVAQALGSLPLGLGWCLWAPRHPSSSHYRQDRDGTPLTAVSRAGVGSAYTSKARQRQGHCCLHVHESASTVCMWGAGGWGVHKRKKQGRARGGGRKRGAGGPKLRDTKPLCSWPVAFQAPSSAPAPGRPVPVGATLLR